MTRKLAKMPTPSGIGKNQTATLSLPIGLTYDRLYIHCNAQIGTTAKELESANWDSVIGEIRLIANGNARITIDAKDLVALNAYYGFIPKPGILPIFLARPFMRTMNGEDQTSYGTVGMASLSMEIDLKGAHNINNLTVSAVQSEAKPDGAHLRIQKFSKAQGVTGTSEISDIPRGAYAMLAMHVNTDKIGKIEVLTDQLKIIETDKQVRKTHGDISGRLPQSGMTHIDFISENRLSEALPMALQDFRLKMDFEEAGNFSIYTESIVGV